MLQLFRRQDKKQKGPPRFGDTIYTDRMITYATSGLLPGTERLCTHHLTIRKVEPHQVLLPERILGRAITTALLGAERRSAEQAALASLLAVDAPSSHLVTFGLTFHRDQTRKELMGAALNFRVSGWETNSVARECGAFLTFIAQDQQPYLENGRLTPPPLLTQTKVYVRTFWMTAIFRRYRRFALGDE